jgi:hypothetical protein
MLRVAALLLALAVGFDYAMLNGKYTSRPAGDRCHFPQLRPLTALPRT